MAKKTNYEYLLEKQQTGELTRLFSLGLNEKTTLLRIQIYQFHLDHPKASQWDVCMEFDVSKKTVWNIYQLMEKTSATL